MAREEVSPAKSCDPSKTTEKPRAAASGDRINADQFVVVQGLLEEAGADEAKFLQFIGAASLEELTLRQFDTAVAALRKKVAQKKGA